MSFIRTALAVVLSFALLAPLARASECPTAPSRSDLPDEDALRRDSEFLAALGSRPTGSPAHRRYIGWVEERLRQIPGLQLSRTNYRIDRWLETGTRLRVRWGAQVRTLPVAAAVPYSRATGKKGRAAPLIEIPAGTPITPGNANGKVVVRQMSAGTIDNYLFLLPIVTWGRYDPENSIDPFGKFRGDFLNYNAMVTDLRAAGAAGAAALLFVKDLPTAQLKGHLAPYEGERWKVPGQFLGADEGAVVRAALRSGSASARVIVRASSKPVTTPTVLATLPGASREKLVVESHTDGTNVVEDNGPIAMVAMARYFASLPAACRPRDIQFVFSTAHWYQRVTGPEERDGASEQYAKVLDAEYDEGKVSAVVAIEHLGAREYAETPRAAGLPGKELRLTGLPTIQFVAITQSVALVALADEVVRKWDMKRTLFLQGADAPGATTPMHCSFGGEATPYNQHLLPTIGVISAPESLYDPAFGMESLDLGLMRRQTIGFTEMLLRMTAMPQADIAGLIPVERARRGAGAEECPDPI